MRCRSGSRFSTLRLWGVLCCAAWCAGCGGDSRDADAPRSATGPTAALEPVARPAPASQGYVGSAACVDCHAEIAESYRTHSMSHSLMDVLAEPVEEYGESAEFATDRGEIYRVERDGNLVRHWETRLDADGETICEQGVDVPYAVGSGHKGRSYLINHGGLLFMSPITWYTEGQRFDLSPGYVPGRHARFLRRISDGCLTCHAGRLAPAGDGPHRFEPEPFLEQSIGCERCHGPGEEHIAFQASLAGRRPEGDERDPIVNPAGLTPRRRDDVCNQCHIQGLRRIVRYGRTEFDFRPGDRLDDVWLTFVRGLRIDETGRATKAVSHVEQMHASQCFIGTGGELTCVACHDPHGLPSPDQRVAFYRQRCVNCHDAPEQDCSAAAPARAAVADSCVDCHMPRLDASDVPHTTQTDHRILRQPLASLPDLPGGLGEEGPRLFGDGTEDLPPVVLQRGRGLFFAQMADERQDRTLAVQAVELLEPIVDRFPGDADLFDALGACHWLLGDGPRAEHFWQLALDAQPGRELAVEGLLLVCYQTRRYDEGLRLADRLLELNAAEDRHHLRRAQFLEKLNRLPEAIDAAQAGLERNPTSRDVLQWLSDACAKAGRTDEAEEYRRRRDRLASAGPAQSR